MAILHCYIISRDSKLFLQIILGAGFRIYESVAQTMNWKTKECWKINRGDLSPVMSCEGSGDPVYFYLNGVWLCAALTMAFTFLLATEMRCILDF